MAGKKERAMQKRSHINNKHFVIGSIIIIVAGNASGLTFFDQPLIFISWLDGLMVKWLGLRMFG
jgi:hypothetical protein